MKKKTILTGARKYDSSLFGCRKYLGYVVSRLIYFIYKRYSEGQTYVLYSLKLPLNSRYFI